jgi:RNA polymerase sigma-70 factor, ECF subfamily
MEPLGERPAHRFHDLASESAVRRRAYCRLPVIFGNNTRGSVSNESGGRDRQQLQPVTFLPEKAGVHVERPCQVNVLCDIVGGLILQVDLTMGNLASAITIHSEEAALVEELQAGSEEAFAWLIAHYHQPIYSLLARMLIDRADAADLTQDVFVKVFRGVGSFHGQSSLRTWIYRIALREASNQRRWWMRHKQQEVPIEQESADPDSGSPLRIKEMLVDRGESPFEAAVHSENRARVEEALRQVPEPYRSTLILRDIEGFVYEEVAEMQGVNLGTVKSRLVRGRAYLKTLLAAPRTAPFAGEHAPLNETACEEAR